MHPNQLKISIKYVFIGLILNYSINLFSQQNLLGGSFVYNLHTRSLGMGLRVEIPVEKINLLEGISIVSQITYYPPFNPIHEFYIGSSAHLYVYSIDRWSFYTLANISYNGWINNDDDEFREGQFSNPGVEAGVGISRMLMKCLKPFFECRYNFKWNDFTLGLGLMYILNCDRRGMVPCSRIPPQPSFEK